MVTAVAGPGGGSFDLSTVLFYAQIEYWGRCFRAGQGYQYCITTIQLMLNPRRIGIELRRVKLPTALTKTTNKTTTKSLLGQSPRNPPPQKNTRTN